MLRSFALLSAILLSASVATATEPSFKWAFTDFAAPAKKVAPAVRSGSVTVTYRAPIGHTHTCTSCGTTWDHTANPSHTCANCGGHPPMSRSGGYYADPVPKPVAVRSTTRTSTTQTTVAPAAPAERAVTVQSVTRSVQRSSANCPNGNCPYVR
jgi:hypothetical protein